MSIYLPTLDNAAKTAADVTPLQDLDMSLQRLCKIYDYAAKTKIGADMLETLSLNVANGNMRAVCAFDPFMEKAYGRVYSRQNSGRDRHFRKHAIYLAPQLSDPELACVLLHEVRHTFQPVLPGICSVFNALSLKNLFTRLREGDTFTHQIAFGLDMLQEQGDDRPLKFMRSYFKGAAAKKFDQLADAYQKANDPDAKMDVIAEFFWLTQRRCLSAYDKDTLSDREAQSLHVHYEDNPHSALRHEDCDLLLHQAISDLTSDATPHFITCGGERRSYLAAHSASDIAVRLRASLPYEAKNKYVKIQTHLNSLVKDAGPVLLLRDVRKHPFR